MKRLTDYDLAKFKARFHRKPGCWEWTGNHGTNGYGQLWVSIDRDNPQAAHRLSWMIFKGPIPAGKHILHKCDNRLCVRPSHLFIGGRKENMQDMIKKGRSRFQHPLLPSYKLTASQVRIIRKNSKPLRIVAKEFRITPEWVSKIRRNLGREYVR